MTETQQIADVVVAAVRAATSPMLGDLTALHTRLSALEVQHREMVTLIAAIGDRITSCESDMSACMGQMSVLAAKIDAMPAPMAGKDGVDGKDGRDGAQGPAGERGDRGSDGVAGAMGPAGEKGMDGRDGQPGVPGAAGRDGASGERGEKGQDGAAGRDGTLEGATVAQIGDRGFEILRADGSRLGVLELPVPLYRGVYAAGTGYVKGDTVTYGGSMWIARDVTTDKPGDGATAWQLAVKAGRDGKEGKTGPQGPSGAKGDRGDAGRDYR